MILFDKGLGAGAGSCARKIKKKTFLFVSNSQNFYLKCCLACLSMTNKQYIGLRARTMHSTNAHFTYLLMTKFAFIS